MKVYTALHNGDTLPGRGDAEKAIRWTQAAIMGDAIVSEGRALRHHPSQDAYEVRFFDEKKADEYCRLTGAIRGETREVIERGD